MDCLCQLSNGLKRTARLLNVVIGVGDYDAYLAHMQAKHPDVTPLDRAGFVAARQEARFAGGGMRCC
jgi:uncharacterized short protein YbdD (DUF466 family)